MDGPYQVIEYEGDQPPLYIYEPPVLQGLSVHSEATLANDYWARQDMEARCMRWRNHMAEWHFKSTRQRVVCEAGSLEVRLPDHGYVMLLAGGSVLLPDGIVSLRGRDIDTWYRVEVV